MYKHTQFFFLKPTIQTRIAPARILHVNESTSETHAALRVAGLACIHTHTYFFGINKPKRMARARVIYLQPIAFGASFLESRISIDNIVL